MSCTEVRARTLFVPGANANVLSSSLRSSSILTSTLETIPGPRRQAGLRTVRAGHHTAPAFVVNEHDIHTLIRKQLQWRECSERREGERREEIFLNGLVGMARSVATS